MDVKADINHVAKKAGTTLDDQDIQITVKNDTSLMPEISKERRKSLQ